MRNRGPGSVPHLSAKTIFLSRSDGLTCAHFSICSAWRIEALGSWKLISVNGCALHRLAELLYQVQNAKFLFAQARCRPKFDDLLLSGSEFLQVLRHKFRR